MGSAESRSSRRAPRALYTWVKRAVDVTVAAMVLLLFSPVLAGVAVVILVTMGRPVLFRQQRPGRHGELFTICKFRTMRAGSGSDAARLTMTGQVLRACSLDELPQLLNVLRGEMSLVGPRPLLPEYLPLYNARQARRQEVPPGITGLAQVNGRNALDWAERLELDVQYVEQRSLRLDLRILWQTVHKTAARDGVAQPGQATMSLFTGTPSPVSHEVRERGVA